MKSFYVFTLIGIFLPAYAACPIDGNNNACIAEFNSFNPPLSKQIEPIQSPSTLNNRKFTELSGNKQNINNTENEQSTRIFRPQNSNYSYNASCQFGNCQSNGTPKNVSAE